MRQLTVLPRSPWLRLWSALALLLACATPFAAEQTIPAQALEIKSLDQKLKAGVPHLLETATNQTESLNLRLNALNALHEIGFENSPQFQEFISFFQQSPQPPELKLQFLKVIGAQLSFPEEAGAAFMKILAATNEPAEFRHLALYYFDRLPKTKLDATPTLRRILLDRTESLDLRLESLRPFQTLPSPNPADLRALLGIAQNQREPERLRVECLRALAGSGPTAEFLFPAVADFATDKSNSADLRMAAAQVIERIATTAPNGFNRFVSLMCDPSEPTPLRESAARFLERAGAVPAQAAQKLVSLFENNSQPQSLRWAAGRLLQPVAGQVSVSTIRKILDRPNEADELQLTAVGLLDQTKIGSPDLFRLLVFELANHPSQRVAAAIAERLAHIAADWQNQSHRLTRTETTEAQLQLRLLSLATAKSVLSGEARAALSGQIDRALGQLAAEKSSRSLDRFRDWQDAHPLLLWNGLISLSLTALLLAGVNGVWFVLARRKPAAFVRLYLQARRCRLHRVSCLCFWRSHPFVLATRIAGLLPKSSQVLASGDAFVPMPMAISGTANSPEENDSSRIVAAMRTAKAFISIQGPARSGKSELARECVRLACRVPLDSNRALVPICLTADSAKRLLELRGWRSLAAAATATSLHDSAGGADLLKCLDRNEQLLVLADGFSEWADTAQEAFIRLATKNRFRAVITTRGSAPKAGRMGIVVETQPLGPAEFVNFVLGYAANCGSAAKCACLRTAETQERLNALLEGKTISAGEAIEVAKLALEQTGNLPETAASHVERTESLANGSRLFWMALADSLGLRLTPGQLNASEKDEEFSNYFRIRDLTRQLLARDNQEREATITTMIQSGPALRVALPELLQACRDAEQDLEARQAALQVICAMPNPGVAVTQVLLAILQDRAEHLFFRLKAMETLCRLKPDLDELDRVLARSARDPQELPFFRAKVAEALRRVSHRADHLGQRAAPTDIAENQG